MATREIAGGAMADHLRAELCARALLTAIQRRQPPRGPTHHGDRRVQHAGTSCRQILQRHGLAPSPQGQRPRRGADGKRLRPDEEQTRPPHPLRNPRGRQAGLGPMDRVLPQSSTSSFSAWLQDA
ncbi:MAG: hypothetical protein R3F54_16985 [Alphaproteobacteria bacterium]